MTWRNHWIHLHHYRLMLHISFHSSPFDALDEEVNKVVYAGVISTEGSVESWKEWWDKNRDKPFHITYLTNNGDTKDD